MSLNTILNQPAIIEELAMLINGTPTGTSPVAVGSFTLGTSPNVAGVQNQHPLVPTTTSSNIYLNSMASQYFSFTSGNTNVLLFPTPKATDAYLVTVTMRVNLQGTAVTSYGCIIDTFLTNGNSSISEIILGGLQASGTLNATQTVTATGIITGMTQPETTLALVYSQDASGITAYFNSIDITVEKVA